MKKHGAFECFLCPGQEMELRSSSDGAVWSNATIIQYSAVGPTAVSYLPESQNALVYAR